MKCTHCTEMGHRESNCPERMYLVRGKKGLQFPSKLKNKKDILKARCAAWGHLPEPYVIQNDEKEYKMGKKCGRCGKAV